MSVRWQAHTRDGTQTNQPEPNRHHLDRSVSLDIRALRRLRGVSLVLAVLLPIGVPVAIFHFAGGRIGNGIMLTTALLVGVVMVVSDLRGAQDEPRTVPAPVDGPNTPGGPDEGGDGWLDRPTDAPLPGPFQAAFDEIMRGREPRPVPGREQVAREERHEV